MNDSNTLKFARVRTLLSGHYWTLREYFWGLREADPTRSMQRWALGADNPHGNRVHITGALCHADSDELVVVLHGLGGSISSSYMPKALRAASQAGVACLLLNSRGAGAVQGGVGHAALIDDLCACLASNTVSRYRHLYLFGYSIGGHVALIYGAHRPDPRLRGIVAACSPIDLKTSMQAFDRPVFSVYRYNVLSGLIADYERWARVAAVPTPLAQVRRIRRVQQWDEWVITPVFGFDSVWDYYAKSSAATRLGSLHVPSLYVGARPDPMVPPGTVEPALAAANEKLRVVWSDVGGHLAFPKHFSFGMDQNPGLEAQAIAWLRAQPKL